MNYLGKHAGDHSVTTEACSSPHLTGLGLCATVVWKLNGALCAMYSQSTIVSSHKVQRLTFVRNALICMYHNYFMEYWMYVYIYCNTIDHLSFTVFVLVWVLYQRYRQYLKKKHSQTLMRWTIIQSYWILTQFSLIKWNWIMIYLFKCNGPFISYCVCYTIDYYPRDHTIFFVWSSYSVMVWYICWLYPIKWLKLDCVLG